MARSHFSFEKRRKELEKKKKKEAKREERAKRKAARDGADDMTVPLAKVDRFGQVIEETPPADEDGDEDGNDEDDDRS